METAVSIGAVIIGRNEGKRLLRCLLSVVGRLGHVVYADSGSIDGSADLAHENGATVVVLNNDTPFTAARGRNIGFAHLMKMAPDTEYVQFIDGDCELMDGWLETAREFLQGHLQHAIVCGRLREQHPEVTIYNRLCNIEWNGPEGKRIDTCGGIFMVRAKAFAEVGGMNSTIFAGEEPEMCLRLREKDWLIARIDKEMALHDANITSFGLWWKRAVRSGRGSIDVFARTGGQAFATQVKRTWLWTIGWAMAFLFVLASKPILGGTMYISAVLGVMSLYPAQVFRIAARMRNKGLGLGDALFYGSLMMIGKWAELYGHLSHHMSTGKNKIN